MHTPAQLMSGLLDYLVEQAKDIDPTAFTLSKATEFKKTFADLGTLPWVDFDVDLGADTLWLRVQRLEATPAPALSEPELAPFLTVSNDPTGNIPIPKETALAGARHQDAAALGDEEAGQRDEQRRARVGRLLEEYLPHWRNWAAREKPRRQVITLYADLFALKTRLESEEAVRPLELVWGIGVSSWRIPLASQAGAAAAVDYHYPLITQAVEIDIDSNTHAIGLRPRETEPRLEFDAFAACAVPGIGEVERSARTLLGEGADMTVSPFAPSTVEPILKLVAGNLSATARYDREAAAAPAPGEDLVVTDGWVVFTRPRAGHFLIEDIARLKERVAGGDAIPAGPLSIVTAPGDAIVEHEPIAFRGLSGRAAARGEPRELYFPLPYNREQETIVQQLERSPGVAVQGPPGTGKTHTIANIISHYLASGKRILVTSKGEPALKVLQEKIPASIRPLTVALLSGDKEGMRQFQASIEAIVHTLTHMNPRLEEEAIAACRVALDRAHEEMARIDTRIDDIAHAQLGEVDVDGVPMRAQKMAELVIHGHQQFGWFDDVLSLAPEHAPPFGDDSGMQLREARRRLGSDLVYCQASVPASAALPPAADIGRLHGVLQAVRDIERDEASGALLPLRATTPEVLEHAGRLLAALDLAAALVHELEESGHEWVFAFREKCRQAQFATERSSLEALFTEMDALLRARAEFMQKPVMASREALEHAKALEAIARGVDTGKPFGLLAFGVGDIKPHVNAIRVAGLAPASGADWAHVQRFAALHTRLLSFTVRWNAFAELLSLPTLQPDVAQLRTIELIMLAARGAHTLATTHDLQLPLLAEQVFAQAPKSDLAGRHAGLARVREHLRRHLMRAELAQAAAGLASLRETLAGATGPVSDRLRGLAEHALGSADLPAERIVADYADMVAEVRRVEALAPDLATVRQLAGAIERQGAARLAARVLSVPLDAAGDDAVFPVRWRDAWTWARLGTHLDEIDDRDEMRTLAARRRDLEQGLARLYEELVSRSSWLATRRQAGHNVLAALETYRTAMRKFGKGTGVNAARYRRDAQKAMVDAQAAVPCWIMSHARVSESLPAELGAFDLVIVDEASQSDLWALPAVLRGKQILVVGDDKQVSPEAGFVSAAKIAELRSRFLAGQPFEAVLTADMSLYDIASSVFAASKVMLREHFRCVQPIIAYSNRVFYKGFIQPLRIPKASERLDPPLVDVFVANGYRTPRGHNPSEAEFIAAEIEAILRDPALRGRSLGVVSLLGPEQAQFIDKLVRSRCDAQELARRNFACGDARVFQGSERDIVFLSMVADSANHHALSGITFDQRFNVAASRARDRMFLVRSVRLEELSTLDLRRTLVEHFAKPVEANDDATSLVELCESGFERDVYRELFERGYRVIPQVPAAGYRIDMVVEGADDRRLAIELDGDEFHGPDKWPADMRRQRVLERAGWTFWRCFASTWSLQREEVLAELLAQLSSMGIDPLGALERIPSLVEYREWGREPAPVHDEPAGGTAEQADTAAAAG
ncbi:AAA domain-containing protein [Massilia niastensis]|uniref:AAA domain-containing protein n=1 Tax=Massilia niastensis TaxID=544911 RepID=UPI00039D0682|nr:AAA domain-containing protein [Massilia niastensis]